MSLPKKTKKTNVRLGVRGLDQSLGFNVVSARQTPPGRGGNGGLSPVAPPLRTWRLGGSILPLSVFIHNPLAGGSASYLLHPLLAKNPALPIAGKKGRPCPQRPPNSPGTPHTAEFRGGLFSSSLDLPHPDRVRMRHGNGKDADAVPSSGAGRIPNPAVSRRANGGLRPSRRTR